MATDIPDFLDPLITDEASLTKHFRSRSRKYEEVTVLEAERDTRLMDGWEVRRESKDGTKIRVRKPKPHHRVFENRVWNLWYKMGYKRLNGEGFKIKLKATGDDAKQIDVYAEDEEVAFIIECKSNRTRSTRPLKRELLETEGLQSRINPRFSKRPQKRKMIWIYATENIIWSEKDLQRASDANIHVLTENELQYFESLIRHMGPAGRYQILGDFLKGQRVRGLEDIQVPAIKGKLGGVVFYSFVTTPRNLMRVASINHHARKSSDEQPAYQRMVASGRIKAIGKYIEQGGYFPTNILLNLPEAPRWDLLSNKKNTNSNIKFGWLTLPAKYCSARVIDGQHRLYGFSHLGDEHLDNHSLFVLAFEKLPTRREAKLFITINDTQKNVPRSLLAGLQADLDMDATDPSAKLRALCSAVVGRLDRAPTSPLHRRFKEDGIPPEPPLQCLTVSEIVKGLRSSSLIGTAETDRILHGPLWGATDEKTVAKAHRVLEAYFVKLMEANEPRWNGGRDQHIATNVGIRAHIRLIGAVEKYLHARKNVQFRSLTAAQCAEKVIDFCKPVFDHINSASDKEIEERYSKQYGEGGVRTYAFNLMSELWKKENSFGDESFHEWRRGTTYPERESDVQFLARLSERIRSHVVSVLKEVHTEEILSSDEPAWREKGVPSAVERRVFNLRLKDTEKKRWDEYLGVLDLRDIIRRKVNWGEFKEAFNRAREGEEKGGTRYLSWMSDLDALLKSSSKLRGQEGLSDDDQAFIGWLREEISPNLPGDE